MKKKILLLVAGVAGLCSATFAQSVDQGRKFLYYQRYKSASDVFDKILAANPNNIEAIYWKGQTLFGMKDSSAACDLYSKALQTNGNAPMLLVGMGGCELRMGKTQDARQRFETAISLTKGKDIPVLNAVADNNIDAPQGDAQYAIQKLSEATQIKKFADADTYVLMGDAYRKLIDGGNAVQSYQKALTMDPKLAEAKFKIGKIYETQNNREFFLPAYSDAIQMDPTYAPVYYELYYYWYTHGDLNKAADYMDKFIANSDPGTYTDIAKIDLLFLQGKFQDARTRAQAMVSQMGNKPDPLLYKLIAYSCDTLGDIDCAQQNMNTYFQKQLAADLLPRDYEERAHIETKSKDSATMNMAFADYEKAIQMDTLPDDRAQFTAEATTWANHMNNKPALAELAAISYASKKNPTNTDLYNWGMANYKAENYKTADSIFCGIYESKYPDEVFGYLWCMRSKAAQDDSVGSQGIAVDAEMKLAEFGRAKDSIAKAAGSKDSTQYLKYVVQMYSQLAFYYNNTKKDKEQAVYWLRKILEVEPTNPDAAKYIDLLTRPPRKTAAPAAKPKSGAERR
jgi:tetratricopeptide (TPR) repeat protein